MRGFTLAAVALLLSTPALAGCLDDGDAYADRSDEAAPTSAASATPPQVEEALPEPVVVVTDPAGDATTYNGHFARTAARKYCDVLPGLLGAPGTAARAACRTGTDNMTSAGAVPARPDLDALALTFTETPADLIVEMELARVDPDLSDAFPEGQGVVEFGVCLWRLQSSECQGYAYYWALKLNGDLETFAGFRVMNDPAWCGGRINCQWQLPPDLFEVVPGTPGRLRWTIPRVLMPNASEGDVLREPAMVVLSVLTPGELTVRASVTGPASTGLQYSAWQGYYRSDESELGKEFTFSTTLAPLDRSRFADGVFPDNPGESRNPSGRRDLDVLSFSLVEDPVNLTLAAQMAEVAERPADHDFSTSLSISNGAFLQAGYRAREGELAVRWSYTCAVTGCGRVSNVASTLTVTPGAPGWINYTVQRRDVRAPGIGDFVTGYGLSVTDWTGERNSSAAVGYVAEYYTSGDYTWSSYPYFFHLDTEASVAALGGGTVIDDEPGDTAPVLADQSAADQFDVTFLEARARSASESRLTLGVRDLSRVAVPVGYDAVLYAVGMETDAGTFMAGYYKDRDRYRAGEFFCSQDTAVFVPNDAQRFDPTEVVWQSIDGIVSFARRTDEQESGETAGAGNAGALTFFAPHACFGQEAEGTLTAKRLAAGSFLVQRIAEAQTRVLMVDLVTHGEPTDLVPHTVAAPPRPWYEAPFGLENFWDLFGLALAVVVSGTGVALVQRRRGILKRYLHDVDRAASSSTDAKLREAALRDVRDRLKADLVRGRISEGHYVIVESRLDGHLSKARVEALAGSFGNLTYTLLQRLQELLKDGHMSHEEYVGFCDLLDEAPLQRDAKERIRTRLERWVAEDKEGAA